MLGQPVERRQAFPLSLGETEFFAVYFEQLPSGVLRVDQCRVGPPQGDGFQLCGNIAQPVRQNAFFGLQIGQLPAGFDDG